MIVTIPLFFLLSLIVPYFITDSENVVLIFRIIFILFNILLLIRNSIVKVYSDRIILRDCIGAKKIIETENITFLRIISYKELKQMIFKTSSLNPLISNCSAFFIPMGKFITFKNKFNRDVVIGVWNYKKLYDILCEAEPSNTDDSPVIIKETAETVEKPADNTRIIETSILKCLLKMPLKMHIVTFFRNFLDTLFLPTVITLYLMWLFNRADIYVNKCIWLIPFLLISVSR